MRKVDELFEEQTLDPEFKKEYDNLQPELERDRTEKEPAFPNDITYYAKDSRLTEPSDGKRYRWREMVDKVKELGRPLTVEEAEEFRVK